MRFAATALLSLFLLSAGGCRLPRDTAARVDGRDITAAELAAAVRDFTSSFGQAPPGLEQDLPRVRRGVLERLVDRQLMLAEAERRKIRPTPEQVDQALAPTREGMSTRELDATLAEAGTDRERWRRAAEQDLAIARLQAELTASLKVSEQEITDWISRHREGTEVPEQVRASQILLRTEAEAIEARRAIQAGTPFADVARRVSASPDAERGGDLGYFSRGQMPPEFDEVAFTLPRGQLSDIVETPYGFHLFLVTDRRVGHERTAAEVRSSVSAAVLAQKREAAFREWLAGARSRAKITYNRSLVPER